MASPSPLTARELRLLCPHCTSTVYVTLRHPVTPQSRHKQMHDAIEEHRRLCPDEPPEAGRVYRIDYPRGA